MKFTVSHELAIAADQYWKHLFNPELEAYVKSAVGLEEFTVTNREEGNLLVRAVRVIPKLDLPGPLKKVFGDNLGYREEDRVPKGGAMEYTWKATPDTMPDKISMGGTFKIEPLGAGRCKRTINGDVTVKIFGLGGLAEKFVIGELERSYSEVARAQERWIKQNGQA